MSSVGNVLKGGIAIGLAFAVAPIPGVGQILGAALFSWGAAKVLESSSSERGTVARRIEGNKFTCRTQSGGHSNCRLDGSYYSSR